MVLGKLEIHIQQNETKPLSLTLHKTQLKMNQGLRNYTREPALIEEKVGLNLHHVGLGLDFLNKTPKV